MSLTALGLRGPRRRASSSSSMLGMEKWLGKEYHSGEFAHEKKPSHLGSSSVGLQWVELELV